MCICLYMHPDFLHSLFAQSPLGPLRGRSRSGRRAGAGGRYKQLCYYRCMYIYIYIERERCVVIYVCIYIYTCIYTYAILYNIYNTIGRPSGPRRAAGRGGRGLRAQGSEGGKFGLPQCSATSVAAESLVNLIT